MKGMRDDRQTHVAKWAKDAFGVDSATYLPQRGVRLLEEAIELYQATGATPEMAHKLVDFVFGRPVGEIFQEIGGVAITLLVLSEAASVSAEAAELAEYERILAKPLATFTARNAEKNAAGFKA